MFRMKRAEIHSGNRYALRQKFGAHPPVEVVKLLLGIVTASNTGLIGHNNDEIIVLDSGTTEIEHTVDKLKIFFFALRSPENII